ncbi:hypothetical protein [Guyparkeria sp.]
MVTIRGSLSARRQRISAVASVHVGRVEGLASKEIAPPAPW